MGSFGLKWVFVTNFELIYIKLTHCTERAISNELIKSIHSNNRFKIPITEYFLDRAFGERVSDG